MPISISTAGRPNNQSTRDETWIAVVLGQGVILGDYRPYADNRIIFQV
jgi:hypothetical protein